MNKILIHIICKLKIFSYNPDLFHHLKMLRRALFLLFRTLRILKSLSKLYSIAQFIMLNYGNSQHDLFLRVFVFIQGSWLPLSKYIFSKH